MIEGMTKEEFIKILDAALVATVKNVKKCRYPECVKNDDERCPEWLIGDCHGPDTYYCPRHNTY